MFRKFVAGFLGIAVLLLFTIHFMKKNDAKQEIEHVEHNIKFEQNRAIALEVMDQVDDTKTNWSAVQNTKEVRRLKGEMAIGKLEHKKAAKSVDESLDELAAELNK